MSTWVLILSLLALGVFGCGKHAESTPAAESARTNESTSDADANAASAAQTAAQLSELTQAVRRYAAEQRRVPQDLQELVGKGYIAQVPMAPEGKKFAINKELQVILVGQ